MARKGSGRTSPNPMVGAVVVRKGSGGRAGISSKGRRSPCRTRAPSLRPAEKAKGATLYVNLEPCNHFGRTPPCTQAILESGIKKVVFGIDRSQPEGQRGRGPMASVPGIEVVRAGPGRGVPASERSLSKVDYHRLPFVILKAAVSLDGRIATRTGDSKWISNERSRLLVHRLRNQVDGVLVGIGTVLGR